VGEKIFQPLSSRREVGRIIRHHHERWDGSGYPDGLVGEQIPWLAQIFQILDIYDALTSDRSYKDAVSSENALAILNQEVEQGWRNPDLVAKFADFISQQTQNKS
jgi:putative two-component system response regulator